MSPRHRFPSRGAWCAMSEPAPVSRHWLRSPRAQAWSQPTSHRACSASTALGGRRRLPPTPPTSRFGTTRSGRSSPPIATTTSTTRSQDFARRAGSPPPAGRCSRRRTRKTTTIRSRQPRELALGEAGWTRACVLSGSQARRGSQAGHGRTGANAAAAAGFRSVHVEGVRVPFPDLTVADLVEWRLGMAQTAWFVERAHTASTCGSGRRAPASFSASPCRCSYVR